MKKALILTALISSMLFSFSCGGKKEKEDLTKDGTFAGLSVGMEREIEEAKGEEIVAFFGEYDGVYAVVFDGNGNGTKEYEFVGESAFIYLNEQERIEIYNDGIFYTATEAFKNELISTQSVREMREKHKEKNADLYAIRVSEEELTQELSDNLLSEIAANYAKAPEYAEITAENFWIVEYYGKYGDYYYALVDDDFLGGANDIRVREIGGISFVDSSLPMSYKDGKEYDLWGAYSKGFLTKEELFDIREKHRERYREIYEYYNIFE